EKFSILRDNGVDGADMPCGCVNLVQKRQHGHLMRNGHAGATEIAQSAKPLDRIADGLYLPGQIDEVQTQLLKGGIVNGGREGMFDRVSNHPAKLCRSINVGHALIPWRRSFLRRS